MTIRSSKSVLRLVGITCAAMVCLSAAGCAGFLKQPPVAKSYFAIDPGRPQIAGNPAAAPQNLQVVRVRTLRVRQPYDGVAFVYRIGPSQFDTDYYNNFIAPPATLLTGELIDWLAHSGSMTVCDASSDLPADVTIEGSITSLCIDSTSSPPRARVEGRFFFTQDNNGVMKLLADRYYQESAPVSTRSAADFARAWSDAYRQLLVRLTSDLKKIVSTAKIANKDRDPGRPVAYPPQMRVSPYWPQSKRRSLPHHIDLPPA